MGIPTLLLGISKGRVEKRLIEILRVYRHVERAVLILMMIWQIIINIGT